MSMGRSISSFTPRMRLTGKRGSLFSPAFSDELDLGEKCGADRYTV